MGVCSMLDVKKYIGKSYTEYTCYGLFRAIQADLGYDLPDYDAGTPRQNAEKIEMEALSKYVKLDKAVEGCGVIIYDCGLPCHVATYIGEGKIIHSKKDTGVVITDLALEKVYGYYGVRK